MLTRKVKVGDVINLYNVKHYLVASDYTEGFKVGLLIGKSFVMQTKFVKVNSINDITETELREIIGTRFDISHPGEESSVQFEDGSPVFSNYKYMMGDRFRLRNKKVPFQQLSTEEYILASTGSKQATLISLSDGNRWEEPVNYNHIVNKGLTKVEFEMIVGPNYTFVKL